MSRVNSIYYDNPLFILSKIQNLVDTLYFSITFLIPFPYWIDIGHQRKIKLCESIFLT